MGKSISQVLTESDYRAFIAIIFTLGIITVAIITVWYNRLEAFTTVMAVLGPIMIIIIKDYFHSKE